MDKKGIFVIFILGLPSRAMGGSKVILVVVAAQTEREREGERVVSEAGDVREPRHEQPRQLPLAPHSHHPSV